MRPRPRRLEPEELEEIGLKEEIDANFYGYFSVEEKKAHEQQMLEDLKLMELEEERERDRREYEEMMREDMPDPDRDDEWDWGDW
jgi:hypothetical protein